ncbi:uncharacterized protein BO87DRAFT_374904 [Aspergillus neoniger CBS 115656]|uniref:Uncharacterized protein n=1 Tax=Aspergillus neoniger (strain CBS 115656) TaxID=1448310 RepID=A0A318ZKU5_ASPNB|nr:hypothetical protein BO87DRAFT_374904 [Aspergillus neoniger CBS 115656]PYH36562.1 hypothetical protein BO87DRAFT_374904 [Aspergillus neoniger CBS 115656]
MPSWHTIVLGSAIYLADVAAWHFYSVFTDIHRFHATANSGTDHGLHENVISS